MGRIERFLEREFLVIVLLVVAFCAAIIIWGCSQKETTAPSPVAQASAAPTAPPAAVQPVVAQVGEQIAISGGNVTWTNLTGEKQHGRVAWYYFASWPGPQTLFWVDSFDAGPHETVIAPVPPLPALSCGTTIQTDAGYLVPWPAPNGGSPPEFGGLLAANFHLAPPCPRPNPTPTPSPTPRPTPTPTPPPAWCYYEVDCGAQQSHGSSCTDAKKAGLCEAQGGSWAKWQTNHEHCRIAFPGVSLGNFQLNPGKSAPACRSKH